jgi:hypothetical protein
MLVRCVCRMKQLPCHRAPSWRAIFVTLCADSLQQASLWVNYFFAALKRPTVRGDKLPLRAFAGPFIASSEKDDNRPIRARWIDLNLFNLDEVSVVDNCCPGRPGVCDL